MLSQGFLPRNPSEVLASEIFFLFFFFKFNEIPISSIERRGRGETTPLRLSRRFFLAIRDGGARRGAVTFNSRARRRPICVVRAPITPDKVEAIYLPSVGDAITRVRPSSAEGEERARARRWGQGLVEEVEKRVGLRVIYATG